MGQTDQHDQHSETTAVFTHHIYSPQAIVEAIEAYTLYCQCRILGQRDEKTEVLIRTPKDHQEFLDEFLNLVLELSVRKLVPSFEETTQSESWNHFSSRETRPSGNNTETYYLYPFRFRQLNSDTELITNEAGEFLFARVGTARKVLSRKLSRGSELYKDLLARQIIYDERSVDMIDLLATKYRTKKAFLTQGVTLHIVVLTLRCNHICEYCQVSSRAEEEIGYDMSDGDILKCVDAIMFSSGKDLTIEIQGGEPLLVFDKIRLLVENAKRTAKTKGKEVSFVVCTNLTAVTDDMLRYFKDEGVVVSTSLDGPRHVHNRFRQGRSCDSYDSFVAKLEQARDILGMEAMSALTTVTSYSLAYLREIVDEYVKLGFQTVFLRRMSSYGRAAQSDASRSYSLKEFLKFYFAALDYILELNMSGTEIAEAYASILLRKILTPFSTGYVNLQSPAGPGVSVAVYHYNGDIYSQDEGRMLGEMGDQSFRLGNVNDPSCTDVFSNPELVSMIRSSCSETLPGCAECAYLPYCGCDPVHSYAQQGDVAGHRPTSEQCRFNMALFDYLFDLISRDDRSLQRVLLSWARNTSLEAVKEAGISRC